MGKTLISEWFRATGDQMTKSIKDGHGLQSVVHMVSLARRLRKDRNFLKIDSERYIGFMMERFLRSVYGNLFMETHDSKELSDKRHALIKTIGESLKQMSEHLSKEDLGEVHKIMSKMVNEYLTAVEDLNFQYEKIIRFERGRIK